MADSDFPAIGFDPAIGNVATVRDLSKQMIDTGIYAKEAHEVLEAVKNKKEIWTGAAAQAFGQKLGDLPKYLKEANESMEIAGKALSTWSDRLAAHQQRAKELETQAQQAKSDAEGKDAAARSARSTAMNSDDPAMRDDATNKINAANDAWDRLDDIRAEAKKLRDTWEDDGGKCADSLNDAAEKAPNKSFFESFGEMFDDIGKWFKDHLGDIGDIAGIISAVAGALSFIPILAPICGPIALVAGGVALLAHGADMVVNEKWDDPNAWISLAGDVAGLIPGVGVIGKSFGTATDAISGAEKVADVGQALVKGGRTFIDEAGKIPEASRMFTWIADKTVGSPLVHPIADVAAKGMQGGSAVALQIPGALGLFDSSSSTTDAKNAGGLGAAILSGLTIK